MFVCLLGGQWHWTYAGAHTGSLVAFEHRFNSQRYGMQPDGARHLPAGGRLVLWFKRGKVAINWCCWVVRVRSRTDPPRRVKLSGARRAHTCMLGDP